MVFLLLRCEEGEKAVTNTKLDGSISVLTPSILLHRDFLPY